MRLFQVTLACIFIMACFLENAYSQGATPPLNIVVDQLGSLDFAVREAAEAQLRKLSLSDLDGIRRLVREQKDPEVQSRLLKILSEAEVDIALRLPGISLDLKDATLAQVAAAINQSAGSVVVTADEREPSPTFTLKSQNLAFWDLILQMNAQHVINFVPSSIPLDEVSPHTPVRLSAVPQNLVGLSTSNCRVVNGFLMTVALYRSNPKPELRPSEAHAQILLTVIPDPRISVAKFSEILQISTITDRSQKTLARDIVILKSRPMLDATQPIPIFYSRAQMTPSGATSRELGELRGSVKIAVAVAEERFIIDPSQSLNKPIRLPMGTITVTRFEETAIPRGRFANPSKGLALAAEASLKPTDEMATIAPVMLRPIDSEGRVVPPRFSGQILNDMDGQPLVSSLAVLDKASHTLLVDGATGPFKLEITTAKSVCEIALPFEFKNVQEQPHPSDR